MLTDNTECRRRPFHFIQPASILYDTTRHTTQYGTPVKMTFFFIVVFVITGKYFCFVFYFFISSDTWPLSSRPRRSKAHSTVPKWVFVGGAFAKHIQNAAAIIPRKGIYILLCDDDRDILHSPAPSIDSPIWTTIVGCADRLRHRFEGFDNCTEHAWADACTHASRTCSPMGNNRWFMGDFARCFVCHVREFAIVGVACRGGSSDWVWLLAQCAVNLFFFCFHTGIRFDAYLHAFCTRIMHSAIYKYRNDTMHDVTWWLSG